MTRRYLNTKSRSSKKRRFIYVSEENQSQWEALEVYASEFQLSVSDLVSQAVQEFLDRKLGKE